ncbi:STAS domain-containing protein [Paracoccus sp. S-4012]|uniref:SulP family inorganic anion transporter n=1 Tax=Paracoccus sp. S-4012 TaxID=2665648 RepID=UPI0012AFFB6E|nr:SulP family inorganic anion transporter [Paracoccus sp. S-4012]MRX51147.1 STAS domain-containing protein [Paracoccus sp. S-4012]
MSEPVSDQFTRLTRAYFQGVLTRPDWPRRVSPGTLKADAAAGLTGAAIVLPQAVAFASIAGLPAEMGFATAMIPPIVAALTGSSWHAVSGPTTAISVLVFAAIVPFAAPGSPTFLAAAVSLALMVGLVQIGLGLARLGVLIDFVSHSVTLGFVSGAALLIALSQVQNLIGVELPRPNELRAFLAALAEALPQVGWRAPLIGATALVVGLLVREWRAALPNYLIAFVAASALGIAVGGEAAGVAVIGAVDPSLPPFEWPPVSLNLLRDYGSAAVAIALVGLLEALSVARALGVKSGQPIDGNREIVGQGLSNLAGSFFNAYPSSASFTRSGVNFEAGARTPLAAVLSALFLLLLLQLTADLFAYVPLAAMAGVILLVAIRLVDLKQWRGVLRSASEAVIAVVTLLATIFVDLEFAIYAGVILSFVFFMRRSSRPQIAVGAPDPSTPQRMFRETAGHQLPECPQLLMARLDGPLFFGSVEFVRRQFRRFEARRPIQKHLLFIVKGVGEIDLPGADLLIEEAQRRTGRDGGFYLQTRSARTLTKLARFKVMRTLTRERIFMSKGHAIAAIVPQLDIELCNRCPYRIFRECPPLPEGGLHEPQLRQPPVVD